VLSFDQFEIVAKKSAGGQSDNDWLIVYWFVGGDLKQTHTLPLANAGGSTNLQAGQSLQPVTLEVSCVDTDLVTAAFHVVNLGSSSPADQVAAVGKIAQKGAEALTEAYAKAAAIVVQVSGIPLASVFSKAIDDFTPAMVMTVRTAFEDIIIPFFSDVAEFIAGLLGSPNCNGHVLDDVAVFKPAQPVPSQTISKVYTGSSKSGCGTAKTAVTLTLERVLEVAQIFPNTPLPSVDAAPAKGESPEYWLGTWAEDPMTTTPLVLVTISRSMAESGTYAVTVLEHVDRRFGAEFTATDVAEWPESVTVPTFGGNVFGTIKPWLAAPMAPGNLTASLSAMTSIVQPRSMAAGVVAAAAGGAAVLGGVTPALLSPVLSGPEPAAVTLGVKLAWERPKNPILTRPSKGPAQGVAVTFPGLPGYDTVDAFVLEGQGVTVCLYNFTIAQHIVGRCVRYIRAGNASFTPADVVLAKWNPVK
jgi:hypothetical protein